MAECATWHILACCEGSFVGHIVSIVYRPKGTKRPQDRYERVPIEQALLVEHQGIDGDMKGGGCQTQ